MALMFLGMDDLFGVFLFAVMWLSFLLSFLVLFCFLLPSNLVQGLVIRARVDAVDGFIDQKYRVILRFPRLSVHRVYSELFCGARPP